MESKVIFLPTLLDLFKGKEVIKPLGGEVVKLDERTVRDGVWTCRYGIAKWDSERPAKIQVHRRNDGLYGIIIKAKRQFPTINLEVQAESISPTKVVFHLPEYRGPSEYEKYVHYTMYFLASLLNAKIIYSAFTSSQSKWRTYSEQQGFKCIERGSNGKGGNMVYLYERAIEGDELPNIWKKGLAKVQLPKIKKDIYSYDEDEEIDFGMFPGCCKYDVLKLHGRFKNESQIKYIIDEISNTDNGPCCIVLKETTPKTYEALSKTKIPKTRMVITEELITVRKLGW